MTSCQPFLVTGTVREKKEPDSHSSHDKIMKTKLGRKVKDVRGI